MELFAGFGLFSKELFQYNRENYQFDQSQRLDKELMRLEMQIKRFELFREDIRDLVELCVGRMEMYHLVGAMFLEFCVALYCEGRLRHVAPPFLLALFYLSTASAFIYLVLAVWLSMHASICAHSFGVRLLTRFVRLPIPSIAQMGSLNARLADFEQQGSAMVRVPFAGNPFQGRDQRWLQRTPGPEAGDSASHAYSSATGPTQAIRRDLLGRGEQALLSENDMMEEVTTSSKLPGKHVMLFRRLQCKWQCYDAYARVCMSLGCNMILQSICYYLINVTLLEYKAKSCCIAVITVFQLAAVVIAYVDVAHVGTCKLLLMQLPAMLPCFLAAVSMMTAMHGIAKIELIPERLYPAGPCCFVLVTVWFEGLLWLAWPSKDEATLPRRFRAVLFLDVFEEACLDPTQAEEDSHPRDRKKTRKEREDEDEQRRLVAERASAADEALHLAHCALRRWEAVPAGKSQEQERRLAGLRQQHGISRDAINGEAARLAARQGLKDAASLLDDDRRPWDDLTEREQAEDPCSGTLLGPFQHAGRFGAASSYHFDLERQDFVWQIGDGQRVLTLDEVQEMVQTAERQVRQVLSSGPGHAGQHGGAVEATTSSDEDGQPRTLTRTTSNTVQLVSGAVGKSENPLTPVRLPWKVLKGTTRMIQLAWLLMAAMLVVELIYPDLNFDAQVSFPKEEEEEEEESKHGVAGGGEWGPSGHEGKEHGSEEEHGHVEEEHGQHSEGEQGHEEQGHEEEAHGEEAIAHAGEPEHTPEHLDLPTLIPPVPVPTLMPPVPFAPLEPHVAEGSAPPHAERRLKRGWAGWRFLPLLASLPGREVLRPEALSCLPNAGGFLLGSPYELYSANNQDLRGSDPASGFQVQALPRPLFPAGTAAFCAEGSEPPRCLLGAPTTEGVVMWPWGGNREIEGELLHIEGTGSWHFVTGSVLPCDRLSEVLPPEEVTEAHGSEWCLLLAGWDGERLPVVALPLPHGVQRPPVHRESVTPSFDAPLLHVATPDCPGDKGLVAALHLEPARGWLWALLKDGTVHAWDLPGVRHVGRWRPQWPEGFTPAALCEEAAGQLLVAGRRGAAGADLLRALLPASVSRRV